MSCHEIGTLVQSVWFYAILIWLAAATVNEVIYQRARRKARELDPRGRRNLWCKRIFFNWLFRWLLATILASGVAFRFLSAGFNRRVWDAYFVLGPIIWLAFLCFLRAVCGAGEFYFFDSKHYFIHAKTLRSPPVEFLDSNEEGDTFEKHSKRYNDLSKLVIVFSAGAIAFLIDSLAKENPNPSPVMIGIGGVAPIVIGFFGSSVALLIMIMALQATWYEEYRCKPMHDSYRNWKYATCLSLGWTGLLAFGLGIFWLARNLFLPRP